MIEKRKQVKKKYTETLDKRGMGGYIFWLVCHVRDVLSLSRRRPLSLSLLS